MATNIEYSPVDVEDRGPDSINNHGNYNFINNNNNSNNIGHNRRSGFDPDGDQRNDHYGGDGFRKVSSYKSLASTTSSRKSSRSKYFSNCCFSLMILGISVVFLLGVLVGFYVRESQADDLDLENVCHPENDYDFNYDVLGSRHDSVVSYIRGINIKKFVDEFGHDDPVTGSPLEKRLEKEVVSLFSVYGLNSVEVEEHDIVVTAPDPSQPNRLEVLHANGSVRHSFVLDDPKPVDDVDDDGSRNQTEQSQTTQKEMEAGWGVPHVVFSPAGSVESLLVYGHFGSEWDFTLLSKLGVKIKGKTILIRLGRTSVAEKIMNAERFGATAVLLFRDSSSDYARSLNLSMDFIPTVSGATYSAATSSIWRPSIPCQTISAGQAVLLLDRLFSISNNNDFYDDEGQLLSDRDFSLKDIYSQKTGDVNVRLSVFNQAKNQKVRNVIGTINGYLETDRYVIIGAPRSSLPGDFQDVMASTSLLTQIAHGYSFIHKLHKYIPGRTLKLISWGGFELSNAGALSYIQNRHHILDRRTIAYFDLRNLVTGKDFVTAQTSASLIQLLREIAFDIPHPRDPEATLQSSWTDIPQKERPSNNFVPLSSYEHDSNKNPFLHILGVPTVKVQFVSKPNNNTAVTSLQTEEYKHHYKYHMAIIRVLLKMVMSILDNQILPLNMRNFANDISDVMWQTSGLIEQCTDDKESLERAMSASDTFAQLGGDFEELARIFVSKKDLRGVQIVNNVKMMMERLFVVQRNSLSHHMLHPTLVDGSILLAEDMCKYSEATQDWSSLRQLDEALASMIKEAMLTLKQRS